MKKYLIHIEPIAKVGAKISFQIKLPWNTEMVSGLHISVSPKYQLVPAQINAQPQERLGSIWLRLSGKRDVFYAETVSYPDANNADINQFQNIGLVGRNEWWFTGTKMDFFKINVPAQSTIIEGFYEDLTIKGRVDYHIKIYLELKIND